MRNLLIVSLLLSSCARGAQTDEARTPTDHKLRVGTQIHGADCGIRDDSRLSEEGIGELLIGRSANDIRRACTVLRDTVEQGAEAIAQRLLAVDAGRDTLIALVDGEKIWRIEVNGSAFRTIESIGVGTRLHRLLDHDGVKASEGEGLLYVTLPSHCGLSFRISHVPEDDEHRDTWTRSDLERLSSATVVDQVLIVGCSS